MNHEQLARRLTVIETKLDILLGDDALGLPSRVTALEKMMNWARGVAALAAIAGTIIGALGGFIIDQMGIF